MRHLSNNLHTLRSLTDDDQNLYYSLVALEAMGVDNIARLPVSVRILLESLLRNMDGRHIKEEDILNLAQWGAEKSSGQISFIVSRVLLQDFTGVPLLVDLAAMREAVAKTGFDPQLIEPLVPVDLIIDHSVQVDSYGSDESFARNLSEEFKRNRERYAFLKWGQNAFERLKVVPPSIGICHQVNLEYIAQVICSKDNLLFPDTLVGTDSHTTMVAGLGVLGWGVGGIEAEAAMLGQPVIIPVPEVIGVYLSGKLMEGVTATDLTLRVTELLREEKVTGKFVEFFGPGASTLSIPDRATISNMSPEYGATVGFFPPDEKTLNYLLQTGRKEAQVKMTKQYLKAQNLFGMPMKDEINYSTIVNLDLAHVTPAIAGPKRPQDRLSLSSLKSMHYSSGTTYHKMERSETEMVANRPTAPLETPDADNDQTKLNFRLQNGSVVIAAITSCTNTSNPSVMIAAGLLAKKAVQYGLNVPQHVKTSLAPGSRVVSDYLETAGLQRYLNDLGFNLVAYGCTTCIGNSGPLAKEIENEIVQRDLVTASVLSGNRNFEARIHPLVKANFLMSPPLVIAFALAGTVDIDLNKESLGTDRKGKNVYLRDIWPSSQEIEREMMKITPQMFKERYSNIYRDSSVWSQIDSATRVLFPWDKNSSYIQLPPYFANFAPDLPSLQNFDNMRPLAIFGDSVTTDHISPAGSFTAESEAGKFLLSLGIQPQNFNSYGSRRGNHNVMIRGAFANVRVENLMAGGKKGGWTLLMPEKKMVSIFAAYREYERRNTPLIIFAGKDYGMGSSRDWAAKGPALLGVKVVVARSFERIHRSNLIGMGVLPLEFKPGESTQSWNIDGSETFTLLKPRKDPNSEVDLLMRRQSSHEEKITLISALKTESEAEYYANGGIMPFVLRKILSSKSRVG